MGDFLQTGGLTDSRVINYVSQALKLEGVSDVASYWTGAGYGEGTQADIVQQHADVPQQFAAHGVDVGSGPWVDRGRPSMTTTVGPVVVMDWTCRRGSARIGGFTG